jgi:hypothetical protein
LLFCLSSLVYSKKGLMVSIKRYFPRNADNT